MGTKRGRRGSPARQKKAVPTNFPLGEFSAEIHELLSDGRGLATINGKAVMLSGALPNEQVIFHYTNQKKQFLEGRVSAVSRPSPYRVPPRCEVYELCGGCALQHMAAEQQIVFKQQQLLTNLYKQAKVKSKTVSEPLVSQHWGYRRRARVGIKRVGKGEDSVIELGFRGKESSMIVPITQCPVLAPELSSLLQPVAELVAKLSIPDEVTHVDMVMGDNGVGLNFRHMKPLSDADLQKLAQFAEHYHVMLYLQPKGDDSLSGLGHDKTIQYHITTWGKNTQNITAFPTLTMDFMPYHFTQVNAEINNQMITKALDWLEVTEDDEVLDLFCGLGNFTLPLAQRAKSVVGVEGVQSLVDWAKRNAEKNCLTNVDFYCADLNEDTRMMTWRVKRSYNKVLIDPPRSGALAIMPLIGEIKPHKVCYVSCHPATLARDIAVLVKQYGYRLDNIAVMDMFPHTAHVESIALLTKKSSQ